MFAKVCICLLRLASSSVNTIVEQLQEALIGVGFGSFAAIGITACLSVLWLGDTGESYNAFSCNSFIIGEETWFKVSKWIRFSSPIPGG